MYTGSAEISLSDVGGARGRLRPVPTEMPYYYDGSAVFGVGLYAFHLAVGIQGDVENDGLATDAAVFDIGLAAAGTVDGQAD